MTLGKRLGWPDQASAANRRTFKQLFEWYVKLAIPYETLSNIRSGVLVKSGEQTAESVAAGFGGHCVEHAELLAALLRETGFDARMVSADQTDYVFNLSSKLSGSYVLVDVEGQLFMCDSYYHEVFLPVPKRGGECQGRFAMTRTSDAQFLFQIYRNGTVVADNLVYERSTLDERRRIFSERYREFSPFGITAPYYQTKSPHRIALYYSPERDRCLVQEKTSGRLIEDRQVQECEWIPATYRSILPQAIERSRHERVAAMKFLEKGIFNPWYSRILERADA